MKVRSRIRNLDKDFFFPYSFSKNRHILTEENIEGQNAATNEGQYKEEIIVSQQKRPILIKMFFRQPVSWHQMAKMQWILADYKT